jgi:maleylacetoacetate isomerase
VHQGGEQHSQEYLKLNPLAQVPTLTLPDGTTLTQSLAIIDYLDHLAPAPPLYPEDTLQRARSIQLAEIINSKIQPLQNLSLLQKVEREFNVSKAQWGREAIEKGFDALSLLLQQHPHLPYLAATHPTIADLCLIPQLYNARRFKVDVDKYPRLLEVESNCQALDAFKRAVPEAQPDAQL